MRQRRGLRPALITAIAGGVTLALASPAWAADINLKTPHTNVKAADFKQECTGPFANLPEGKDGWHFILPGNKNNAGDFLTVSLKFKNDSEAIVEVNLPADSPEFGFLDKAGNGPNAQVKHAYVFTPAGWTLVSGSATTSGNSEDDFNLSHTCAGTPSDKPSPSPSSSDDPSETPSPTPSESETPGNEPSSPAPGDEGGLPLTGAAAGAIALAGVALVGGGAALMVMRRRRDNITFTS